MDGTCSCGQALPTGEDGALRTIRARCSPFGSLHRIAICTDCGRVWCTDCGRWTRAAKRKPPARR